MGTLKERSRLDRSRIYRTHLNAHISDFSEKVGKLSNNRTKWLYGQNTKPQRYIR